MRDHGIKTILVGKSSFRSGKLVSLAIGMLVITYLLLSHTGEIGDDINHAITTGSGLPVFVLGLIAVAAANAYFNNGFIISFFLVAGPIAGFALSGNIVFLHEPTLLGYIYYTAIGCLLYGIPLSVIGFVLGRVGVRLQSLHPNSTPL